jgi:hypothetical protein
MENLASNQSRMSLRHCLVINFNGRRPSPCLAPSVEDVVALSSMVALGCKKICRLVCLCRAGYRHLL